MCSNSLSNPSKEQRKLRLLGWKKKKKKTAFAHMSFVLLYEIHIVKHFRCWLLKIETYIFYSENILIVLISIHNTYINYPNILFSILVGLRKCCISLQRSYTLQLPWCLGYDAKLYLMVKLQFYSSWECEVPIHCYYSKWCPWCNG